MGNRPDATTKKKRPLKEKTTQISKARQRRERDSNLKASLTSALQAARWEAEAVKRAPTSAKDSSPLISQGFLEYLTDGATEARRKKAEFTGELGVGAALLEFTSAELHPSWEVSAKYSATSTGKGSSARCFPQSK
ncbi:hypothetical protein Y1Q_0005354 [Alligator mississippiensis]|uniref:Uncharacterized protein n=1 Tax=Alligator mississippiensis TaxID=8496 RepID=A0A151MVT7_ALLMI|nr:hypothetical protein Y1Q_0005354 [Alligator mississippiensis]